MFDRYSIPRIVLNATTTQKGANFICIDVQHMKIVFSTQIM